MAQFAAYAKVMDASDPSVPVSYMRLEESYNSGWHGNGMIIATVNEEDDPDGEGLNTTGLLSLAATFGIAPGAPVAFMLALTGADPTPETTSEDDVTILSELPPGAVTRIWPSVITSVTPQEPTIEGASGFLNVSFTDPITYLGSRPIWGAYSNSSLAEVIGGGISLAVGGDGEPTLHPLTPDLPAITILNELRAGLSMVPYVVAIGDTLGGWLADLLLLFSIRIEMRVNPQGGITVVLSDQAISFSETEPPSGFLPVDGITNNTVIPLSFAASAEVEGEDISDASLRVAGFSSITNYPTYPGRGIILDDPLMGIFRRIGALGAVGTVISGNGVGGEEAVTRATGPLYGRYLSSLVCDVNTRQPGLRPGRAVNFGGSIFGIDNWQVARVDHVIDASVYRNAITICASEYSWRPTAQLTRRAPVYVTAIVDGGADYDEMDAVPRDRLGRIPITFSFLPKPTGPEADVLKHGDTDQDGRLELEDFDEDTRADFENREEYWLGLIDQYNDGELDDPFPGQDDEDLTEEERTERDDIATKRAGVFQYLAMQQVDSDDERDRDRDGVISSRDTAISAELSYLLSTPGAIIRIRRQLHARATEDEEDNEEIAPENRIPDELLDEYQAHFERYDGEGDDPNLAHKISAVRAQGWPPRIPVTAVESMAGGLHGLISAHRQGDICRIAVHSPISIELVGYQYRSDRQINDSLVNAATGMVVDHNQGEAWTGFVFRSSESLESNSSDSQGDD